MNKLNSYDNNEPEEIRFTKPQEIHPFINFIKSPASKHRVTTPPTVFSLCQKDFTNYCEDNGLKPIIESLNLDNNDKLFEEFFVLGPDAIELKTLENDKTNLKEQKNITPKILYNYPVKNKEKER